MEQFKKLFSFILILLCIAACNKDKLPEASQIGANTFGCKIDGVTFKPRYSGQPSIYLSVLSVLNIGDYNLFAIHAANQSTAQGIYISYTYLNHPGSYQLRQYPYKATYAQGSSNPVLYTTDSVNTGELILTKCDTVHGIYSGTFSFRCMDPNTGKIVQITDGRFDLKQ